MTGFTNGPGQFSVDLSSGDLLSEAVEEFLSVNVIPVPSDAPPPIMASVKVHVVLPVDRELFLKGTVILHRPGGFLVQIETPVDMAFLRATVRDATVEAMKGGRSPADSDPDSPSRRAVNPLLKLGRKAGSDSPHSQPARAGRQDAGHDVPGNENPDARRSSPGPRPIPKPDIVEQPKRPVETDFDEMDPDEFDTPVVSAVDKITGQPVSRARAQTRPDQTESSRQDPPTQAMWAVREKTSPSRAPLKPGAAGVHREDAVTERIQPGQTGWTDQPTGKAPPPQAAPTTRRSASTADRIPDRPLSADPVDELFALAADAGAIDMIEPDDPSGQSFDDNTNPDFVRPAELNQSGRTLRMPAAGFVQNQADSDGDGNIEQPAADPDPEDPASDPENRELAIRIREMSPTEKQRLARQGRRVARKILIRDNDKTIHKFVFFNPEVRVDEVVEYLRWSGLSSEAIEYITSNRSWMDSREVIFNVVRNPSTPIELAVRYLIKLSPSDWRVFVKPGVVRPAIMNQARRLLLESEKKG